MFAHHGSRYRCRSLLMLLAALGGWASLAVSPCTAADKDRPKSRALVDFEDAKAFRLHPAGAEARVVEEDAGHALEIRSPASQAWPGVYLEPREGRWDLSAFEGVAVDVRNPEDAAVRVLLSVNNAGADGRKGCNTESATAPAHGRATVVVPFGTWHGETNHPIDTKTIVSMEVLLDRPDRAHRFTVDNLRAVRLGEDMTEIVADPFFKQLKPAFGRGVNLGNALEAPKEGAWGVTLEARYFELIAAAGFDSVRIPVRWSAHAAAAPPYAIEPAFLARVDWAVDQALKQRLVPIVNMHHYDELTSDPQKHRERFVALWRQIAAHFKDRPASVAFELLNEPMGKLDADQWNRALAEALAAVRRTNPDRTVVVGGVDWNGIKALSTLELPEDDRHLVVTVHYYSPFQFTHQGASWAGPQSKNWLGTKWTGNAAEQQAVRRDLDAAIAWAVRHRRPIYLGEFGSYNKADLESRVRWTRFVAEEAAKRKMGTAYWEFCASFGLYDPAHGKWLAPLRDAALGKK